MTPVGGTPPEESGLSPGRIGSALAGAALILYLTTLCRTVYLGDSGEIATAIATGGIVHPPGYPIFSLLGRLAMQLPLGEPAFRVGWLSALGGAAAVYCVFRASLAAGAGAAAGAVAAAGLAVALPMWSLATRVEVYSCHAALVAACLWQCLEFRRSGGGRNLCWAAAAFGVGLGHHPTILLALPALALLLFRPLRAGAVPRPLLLLAAGLLAIGPASYLMLAAWASAGPVACWGDPVDLPRLAAHASAKVYRGYLRLPDGPAMVQGLRTAGSLYWEAFRFPLALLPLFGLFALLPRNRLAAGALCCLAGTILAYNQLYAIPDPGAYYLPIWVVGAVLAACGLDSVVGMLGRMLRPALVLGSAAGFGVALPLLANWPACDLRDVNWVRTLARQKLDSTPPGSLLVTQGDNDSFPLLYLQEALGYRRDVLCIDRQALAAFSVAERDPSRWYLHKLTRLGVTIPGEIWAGRVPADRLLEALMAGPLAARPAATTFVRPPARDTTDTAAFLSRLRQRFEPMPHGLVFRLIPRGEPIHLREIVRTNSRLWETVDLPHIPRSPASLDMDQEYGRRHYISMLLNHAHLLTLAGDSAGAIGTMRAAAAWEPGDPEIEQALAQAQDRDNRPPPGDSRGLR